MDFYDKVYRVRTILEKQQWDRKIHRHERTVVQRWITVDTVCPYCWEKMSGVRGWVVEVNYGYPSGETDLMEKHAISCPHCSRTFYMEVRTPKEQESWLW